MDSSSNGCSETAQLALVAYIPGPLGQFLDKLRGDLVSGCSLQSHVTILPPRSLPTPIPKLIADLNVKTPEAHSFEVRLGKIEVFPITNVIYISLAAGKPEIERLHEFLADPLFHSKEQYPFHPHITLAQEIPAERVPEVLERANATWDSWEQTRSFHVDTLTFVRNSNGNGWETLSEHTLQPASLLKTA